MMKDFYQILQVIPQAEPEVIEAAYRRLMRKYHPDTLPSDEHDSEQAVRKAQELNEAHEVLCNLEKRRAYDEFLKKSSTRDRPPKSAGVPVPSPQKIELEQRFYLVRCGTTRRTFKMTLGRRKGWTGPFVVMEFELVFLPTKDILPTEQETVQNLFDTANTLSMGDIDWSGHKCPDCASEIANANGTRATWSMCGTCHRLKCVGSVKRKLGGYYSTCPWCGATNKLTRSIPTGSKDQAIIHGKYSAEADKDWPELMDKDPKRLDSRNKL